MPFSELCPMLPCLSWSRNSKAGYGNVAILPVLHTEIRLHLYFTYYSPFQSSSVHSRNFLHITSVKNSMKIDTHFNNSCSKSFLFRSFMKSLFRYSQHSLILCILCCIYLYKMLSCDDLVNPYYSNNAIVLCPLQY